MSLIFSRIIGRSGIPSGCTTVNIPKCRYTNTPTHLLKTTPKSTEPNSYLARKRTLKSIPCFYGLRISITAKNKYYSICKHSFCTTTGKYYTKDIPRQAEKCEISGSDKKCVNGTEKTVANIFEKARIQFASIKIDYLNTAPTLRLLAKKIELGSELREEILTIPNIITILRIIGTPYLGYLIVQGRYTEAVIGSVLVGITDALDGYIARKFNMKSVFGSIADPAADKIFVVTLTLCLTYSGLIPKLLSILIIGRDIGLVLSAFLIRYKTLPEPKTFKRYWDMSLPSVSVTPSAISKINTLLQMAVIISGLLCPLFNISPSEVEGIVYLHYLTGITTVLSGMGYLLFYKKTLKTVQSAANKELKRFKA